MRDASDDSEKHVPPAAACGTAPTAASPTRGGATLPPPAPLLAVQAQAAVPLADPTLPLAPGELLALGSSHTGLMIPGLWSTPRACC